MAPLKQKKQNPQDHQISIFEFDDFRLFLKNKFEERKRLSAYFSHRYFARKAGFKTPSFLQFVIQGKRNLTRESIVKFINGFQLGVRDGRYFEAMVLFNQASTPEDRALYYEEMLRLKTGVKGKLLEERQYKYYRHWYLPVIREMVSLPGFQYDPKWIQAKLKDTVSLPDIRKALSILSELKLVEKRSDGRWYVTDSVITTGPQVSSILVGNYHRQMAQKAIEALKSVSPEDREITSITASMSRNCFEDIREMIRDFKRTLIEKIVKDQQSEQVYQIQFQMFPFLKDGKE